MRRYWPAIVAVLAGGGLVLQFTLSYINYSHYAVPFAQRMTNFFCYFTIWTNTLVAGTAGALAFVPQSKLAQRMREPRLLTGIAVALVLVGGAYELLLRVRWQPQGWQFLADLLLHDLVPIAFIVLWAQDPSRGRLRWRDLGYWVVYPGCYLVFALLRGAWDGWYAYPFLNVPALGYGRVCMNAGGIVLALTAIGAAFLAADRALRGAARSPCSFSG